ncbi:hypothetical protein [Sorangium sp. So ce1078]|uniref:hypothetical protein n=1 Tax=Sorangium sp. So ce1078 TaxID=3133329 RepID=UPI003F5D6FE2
MPSPPPSPRAPLALLAAVGLVALAVRLVIIARSPDLDTDAYGHFAIARAFLRDPTNLAVHWVWLPGYHAVVAALAACGVGFTGVRVANALLQAAAPFLLFDFVARRGSDDPTRDRDVALLAALAWTIAPLPNLLATSAQTETSFTLLVLASAWAVGRRRHVLAGLVLAAACLVRYEAWGAALALTALRVLRPRAPIGAASFLIPFAAIASWLVLRREVDGSWLGFLRHTHGFASGVRSVTGHGPLLDALWFPLLVPALVLGPAVLLLPLGLSRALRASWLVPAGLLAFLLLSYAGRGALGLPRYYTALVPFACAAIAEGARRLAERAPRLPARPLALAALALTTAVHLARLVDRATAREVELRGHEAAASR